MTISYQKAINPIWRTEESFVIRLSDGASIPFDIQNVDYVEYLAWVEQGNTPLPAENE